jgi:hypothetical protein
MGIKLFNPLNVELHPIRHLLALAGVHHFVHVSRIRINTLPATLQKMSLTISPDLGHS